jgi:hypothetical protein
VDTNIPDEQTPATFTDRQRVPAKRQENLHHSTVTPQKTAIESTDMRTQSLTVMKLFIQTSDGTGKSKKRSQ